MTILSPTKKSSQDSRRKHGKKKSKKRRRKESIILSIKNGAVKLPEKRSKSKSERLIPEPQNGLVKASYKVNALKLRIKTYPEVSASPKHEVLSAVNSQDNSALHSGNFGKSPVIPTNHESESDEFKPKVDIEPQKAVNGIVIVKDKTGKLSAEQLQKKKSKKRESSFDCLKDVGYWKVMPSPRPDRGTDILKLKLSPHKPAKFDSVIEGCSAKYLDIPVKAKGYLSGEESDVLELPAYDKESETASNTVNDSGIEISSSSSCNNGNSVHSVVLDENSPSYFNTEDSLLSFDSPYGEGMNKSEHSICQRCGGVIIETNNNTRSPGKCRCYLSNPNSPFQTPISPVKLSDIHKTPDHSITNLHVAGSPRLEAEKLRNKTPDPGSLCEQKAVNTEFSEDCSEDQIGSKNCLLFTKYEKMDEDCGVKDDNSDVIIVSGNGQRSPVCSPEKEFKGKLRLKLRAKDKSSPNKTWEKAEAIEGICDNNTDIASENKPSPEKHKKNLFGNTSKELSDEAECVKDDTRETKHLPKEVEVKVRVEKNTYSENTMSVRSGTVHSPLIIDDNMGDASKQTEGSDSAISENKLCKKKPLFKTKGKKYDAPKPDPHSEKVPKDKNRQVEVEQGSEISDKSNLASKRPLFKKRISVEECSESTKKPLFKKRRPSTEASAHEKSSAVDDRKVKENDCEKNTEESDSLADSKEKSLKQTEVSEAKSETNHTETEVGVNNQANKQTDDKLGPDSVSDTEDNHFKTAITNPLNLFQQQFLSFLSTNRKSVPETESKTADNDASAFGDNDEDEILLIPEGNPQELTGEDRGLFKSMNFDQVVKSDKGIADSPKELKQANLIESDSFSWLRIFNDNTNKIEEKSKESKESDSVDVMKDLDADLASIGKKMDDSDDDTNSLDMDDMFNMENLTALKPKPVFHRGRTSSHSHVDKESNNGQGHLPYRRRQKAKRTGPKNRTIRKKVELDFVYSDDDSSEATDNKKNREEDPDFNPTDSDDDFITKSAPVKRRPSRNCSQSRKLSLMTNENSGSENESVCDSHADASDGETHGPKIRRSKQVRRSFCSCCLGEQKRASKDSKDSVRELKHQRDTFKLPRGHKQFIRNTLRLLQLQEKLHTLFISLFPDCAEMIRGCRIGTEEFVELIDDILTGLGESDSQFVPLYQDLTIDPKSAMVKASYSECPVNNIGLSFTSPDSSSRPSEIDLASNTVGTPESTDDQTYLLPHNTDAATGCSSLKFENNTLADDQSEETASHRKDSVDLKKPVGTTQDLTSKTAAPYSQSLLAIASASLSVSNVTYPVSGTTSVPSLGSCTNTMAASPSVSVAESTTDSCSEAAPTTDSVVVSSHTSVIDPTVEASDCASLPFDSTVYYPATEPLVEITIDLNAARVLLCKNPKACLDKLHSQIIKLIRSALPDLDLKNYFYKNLDNLEFLIDLLIDANKGREVSIDQEDEIDEVKALWPDSIPDALLVPRSENLAFSFYVSEQEPVLSEQEPYYDSCNDPFKEKIKLQRESLKKDLFVIEEDVYYHSEDVSEKVLDSIETFNKIAQQRQSPRKRTRDGRLRKRSADEKRTLFVQEKLQNTHNSTFVCASYNNNKVLEEPTKKTTKQKHPQDSKEHFMSELNLGDKIVDGEVNKEEHNTASVEQMSELVGSATETENTHLHSLERRKSTFAEEGKNIFELITNA